MSEPTRGELRTVLALLAPGSVLREGIERIIRSGRGSLMVVGFGPEVEPVVSGGFAIDIGATSQRIAELAKMDGALVLDEHASRVLRANVHLVPDSSVPTSETGTRHRSAERTARQTGRPVIAVSESMGMVTLYHGSSKHVVEDVSVLLFRANQALSTLERYRSRFDEVSATLSAREIEGTALLRDAVLALQRAEMLRRIAEEVEDNIIELGTEGRLIRLQLDELIGAVLPDRELLVRDYLGDRRRRRSRVLEDIAALSNEDLLDGQLVARLLAHPDPDLDRSVIPRGYRMLSRIPRLPSGIVERLVDHFGTLPKVMEANVDELDEVEGVGHTRARVIQDGLRRLAEASLIERWV